MWWWGRNLLHRHLDCCSKDTANIMLMSGRGYACEVYIYICIYIYIHTCIYIFVCVCGSMLFHVIGKGVSICMCVCVCVCAYVCACAQGWGGGMQSTLHVLISPRQLKGY